VDTTLRKQTQNNVNKTYTLLQTTGDKAEQNKVYALNQLDKNYNLILYIFNDDCRQPVGTSGFHQIKQ
jgi:hypothetical protein